MAELKFREKGYFLSEKRARAYATALKQKGKRVRVETQYDPRDGKVFSVKVWSAREFRGRNYTADYVRER